MRERCASHARVARTRLSWDFYGPRGERTAQHHASHVSSFLADAGIDAAVSLSSEGPGHRSALCTFAEHTSAADVQQVIARLRPQRVEELAD